MLTATRGTVSFVQSVGVAPSTTTMNIPGPAGLGGAPGPAPVAPNKRWYVPYASIEDLRSAQIAQAGLGIINESDAWLTGRPYGLPGTTAIRLTQVPGGYRNPQGYHYNASMLGDADTANVALQLQSLVEQQKAQAHQLKRIAFWQALGTGLAVGAVALSATLGVVSYVRGR